MNGTWDFVYYNHHCIGGLTGFPYLVNVCPSHFAGSSSILPTTVKTEPGLGALGSVSPSHSQTSVASTLSTPQTPLTTAATTVLTTPTTTVSISTGVKSEPVGMSTQLTKAVTSVSSLQPKSSASSR